MQSVTLYGKGAVLIHDERNLYRSENGQISVPEKFVAGLIAQGWTRVKPSVIEADGLDEAIQELVDAGIVTTSSDLANGEQTIQLAPEGTAAIDEGLAKIESTEDAAIEGADAIPAAHESPEAFKLQEYRDALAAGFSEDEAKALVWPAGHAPAELPTLEG